ncbi:hypothetical protein [Streptosporangium vulgare]|uniref:DUF2264 C-terminal domain-containing protein n=1 Tax=Streptosporangium vulgare TaxID=46190 RepID=UPI00337A94F2
MEIDTWLLPRSPWHVRVHRVRSGRRLLSAEGAFAVDRDPVAHRVAEGRGHARLDSPAGLCVIEDLGGPPRSGEDRGAGPSPAGDERRRPAYGHPHAARRARAGRALAGLRGPRLSGSGLSGSDHPGFRPSPFRPPRFRSGRLSGDARFRALRRRSDPRAGPEPPGLEDVLALLPGGHPFGTG